MDTHTIRVGSSDYTPHPPSSNLHTFISTASLPGLAAVPAELHNTDLFSPGSSQPRRRRRPAFRRSTH